MAYAPMHAAGGGADPLLAALLKPDRKVDYFVGTPQLGRRPVVRAELLDEEARKTAEAISTLHATQLRRFYGSVLSLKREIEINESTPPELIVGRLALLKAHTAYAKKRIEKMPDEFVRFIVRHVASVTTSKTPTEDFLYGFAPCFEAVVAYHKFFEKK
jgi:CRISPR type III-A-associated protein Csm2